MIMFCNECGHGTFRESGDEVAVCPKCGSSNVIVEEECN